MDIIFPAKVENGRIKVIDHPKFVEYLRGLEGKIIELIARLPRKTRTDQQNRFLWGVIYHLISEHTGFSKDEVHDAMRMMFLRDETKEIPTLRSTTSLSTVEMNLYWEKIGQFAAEKLSIKIPDPNEVDYKDKEYD